MQLAIFLPAALILKNYLHMISRLHLENVTTAGNLLAGEGYRSDRTAWHIRVLKGFFFVPVVK